MEQLYSSSKQDSIPEATPQAGTDIASLLNQVLTKNQGDLSKAAIAAATPIPGGHATQIPLSMNPTPRPDRFGQLDKTPVVGAGNARAQGIGNSAIAVMNLVAGVQNAVENKKKVEIASKTMQLINAQQAYDQASQLLQANPQNAAAKEAMDRNKAVMNGLLGDEKFRKALSKGMSIDFTDPAANRTLEHAGVAQGKQMAQAHSDYAEQFNKQTPQTLVPNQQAIAAYQAQLQQQKLNTETMKAFIPLINAQMRATEGALNRQNRLSVEELKQAHEDSRAFAKSQDAWDRLNTQIQSRAQLQKDQFGYKLAEIAAEGNKELQVFHAKLQAKSSDPMAQLKAYNEFQSKSAATVANMSKHISDMETARALAYKDKDVQKNPELITHLDDQLNISKQALKQYKESIDATNDYYKAIGGEAQKGGTNDREAERKSPGDASSYLGDDEEPDFDYEP